MMEPVFIEANMISGEIRPYSYYDTFPEHIHLYNPPTIADRERAIRYRTFIGFDLYRNIREIRINILK